MRRFVMVFSILAWSGLPGLAMAAAPLKVVTSVAPITDIVRNVGGCRIDLYSLIPEGVDSHTFEPIPSDVQRLVGARLIVMNGLDLEASIEKLARKVKKESTPILRLGDETIGRKDWAFDDFSFPKDRGQPNPHLWPNVAYAMRYAEIIRDALIRVDPENGDYYRKNTEAYLSRLRKLDDAIFKTVKTIPEKNRKLLTYHNSFAYFSKRYGMTVIGAIQPANFRGPSAKDVARIIDQIKADQIPAIFGSEVFPSGIINQIGRETKVRTVETLRDDDLPGRIGEPVHSYVGMMKVNLQIMAKALGGDAAAVDAVDPADGLKCGK